MRYDRHLTSYQCIYGLPTALILVQLTITSGAYWNSGYIAPAFPCIRDVDHLKTHLVEEWQHLIGRSSTGLSSSVVHVFGHAFKNKEDISYSLDLLDWLLVTDCETMLCWELYILSTAF